MRTSSRRDSGGWIGSRQVGDWNLGPFMSCLRCHSTGQRSRSHSHCRGGVCTLDFDELSRACDPTQGAIIYCDDTRNLYPPAIANSGIPLDHLYLLRPEKPADRIWAITECLRCPGVAATIANVERLSRIEARRLQLAAERGGGMGLLLRPMIRTRRGFEAPPIYAAATRWLVAPAPGERTVQRWTDQAGFTVIQDASAKPSSWSIPP